MLESVSALTTLVAQSLVQKYVPPLQPHQMYDFEGLFQAEYEAYTHIKPYLPESEAFETERNDDWQQ